MNKQQRDNRANQLNPNNSAYWASRQGSTSKKKAKVHSTATASASQKKVKVHVPVPTPQKSAKPQTSPAQSKKKTKSASNSTNAPKNSSTKTLVSTGVGKYGWVICDQIDRYLCSKTWLFDSNWSSVFASAVIFNSERDAEKIVRKVEKENRRYNTNHFCRIKCVKFS